MRSADSLARFFGLLCRHTVDMQRAAEFPLILLLAGLGIFQDDRKTPHGAWLLFFQCGTEVYRATFLLRLIQRQLMIPADNDLCSTFTHAVENARIRAIAAIRDHHIAGVETIMFQALAFLCITDLHLLK